jgi:hypothetical protein
MDPLLLEALRFGTAIIAGGIVAVIAQRVAFRHARKLQDEERERRDTGLTRALISEIEENRTRLRPPKAEGLVGVVTPDSPTLDSAWVQARGLDLTREQRDACGRAYGLAASFNNALAMLNVRLTQGGGTLPDAHDVRLVESVSTTADRAAKAFDVAFAAIAKTD